MTIHDENTYTLYFIVNKFKCFNFFKQRYTVTTTKNSLLFIIFINSISIILTILNVLIHVLRCKKFCHSIMAAK